MTVAIPGYSAKCKACNSQHRVEIDRRLLGGESARAVSAWLETQGEHSPHQGLANHKATHLAVLDAAKARLAETTPQFAAEVDRITAEVGVLDRIADAAIKVVEQGPDTTMPGVILYTGCLREARAAVVAKHEILHGKKVNVELTGLADLLANGFSE